MDKTKINLERLRAYDAEWEEDKHPRAENGQFTSGSGSSAGGSSSGKAESGNEYGYSRSEEYVANKMKKWGDEQGNIAALEAADAFRDAHEDENDMRQGMSAKEAFAKADKDVQNGMVGGGPLGEGLLRKWWKKWSSKWGPQEEEG